MTPTRDDYMKPIIVAIALMTGAELGYLVLFGVVLFPSGPLVGKLIWTLTCGIAMGSVVGALTIALVVGRRSGTVARLASAAVCAAVGIYCSFLCRGIDVKFNYFGGREYGTLFILSGVIPALAGGLLYGWLLYSTRGRALLRHAGI